MKACEKWKVCSKPGRLLRVVFGAVFILLAAGPLSITMASDYDDDGKDRDRIKIVEPGHTLFGESYNELADKWTNWLQLEPPETNPAFDTDGSFCDLNQEGKFWFLAGTFEGLAVRTCEVPAGKAIFFPILAFLSFPPEFPDEGDPDADPPTEDNVCLPLGKGIEGVRCDVNDDIPVAPNISLVVTLDGEKVEDPFAYRAQSPPGGFSFRIVEGGLFEAFGFPSGPRVPAAVDGYWILLTPLSSGFHTVSFGQDFDGDGAVDFGANYDLTIVGNDHDDGFFGFRSKACRFGKCQPGAAWKW